LEAAAYAAEHGIFSIPSTRAGGVNDDPIADFAIALGSPSIKCGPPRNGHCIHCYNVLTRCEDENPGAKPFDFGPYIRF
jgi:enolase